MTTTSLNPTTLPTTPNNNINQGAQSSPETVSSESPLNNISSATAPNSSRLDEQAGKQDAREPSVYEDAVNLIKGTALSAMAIAPFALTAGYFVFEGMRSIYQDYSDIPAGESVLGPLFESAMEHGAEAAYYATPTILVGAAAAPYLGLGIAKATEAVYKTLTPKTYQESISRLAGHLPSGAQALEAGCNYGAQAAEAGCNYAKEAVPELMIKGGDFLKTNGEYLKADSTTSTEVTADSNNETRTNSTDKMVELAVPKKTRERGTTRSKRVTREDESSVSSSGSERSQRSIDRLTRPTAASKAARSKKFVRDDSGSASSGRSAAESNSANLTRLTRSTAASRAQTVGQTHKS